MMTLETDSPQQRPLRVAVIGAGKMGMQHVNAIGRLPDQAAVVGVVDPAPAARDRVEQLGLPAYAGMDELFAATDVDVVHVCTAPQTHSTLALDAIARGCHVYVEKPFAASAADAEEVILAAAARNLRVCAGHQLLFERPARQLQALLPAVGAVTHVESYFAFRPVRSVQGSMLAADAQLADILPHPVYLLLSALPDAADPVRVEAVHVGPGATVHALLRRGGVAANLVVTLDGRPVETSLRVVGTNGVVHADFVRSSVNRLLGPGSSAIDKILNPYRLARQLIGGTTSSLARRVLRRDWSYPGLTALFGAYYADIALGSGAPMEPRMILETVQVCDAIAAAMASAASPADGEQSESGSTVCVTGGTGFLGRHVVRQVRAAGAAVRVVSRQAPPPWQREPGVAYVQADAADGVDDGVFEGASCVVHCAAATAGGMDAHQRSSIQATEAVLRAAAAGGVPHVVHVSSIGILRAEAGRPVTESTPRFGDSAAQGPYVWGKLESELLAIRLAEELGIGLTVVRPGALIDRSSFAPPGRLGRRIGNVFVAPGGRRETIGTADVAFTAAVLCDLALRPEGAPKVLNVLDEVLPTRAGLVNLLRTGNPDLLVIWLPRPLLNVLSGGAWLLQRVVRPGRKPVNIAAAFSSPLYDTSRLRQFRSREVRETVTA